MTNRIKYILGLMTICILGVILAQGFWLYKDYKYYREQPLFSSGIRVFAPALATTAVPSILYPSNSATTLTVPGHPVDSKSMVNQGDDAIIAYPAAITAKADLQHVSKALPLDAAAFAVTAPGWDEEVGGNMMGRSFPVTKPHNDNTAIGRVVACSIPSATWLPTPLMDSQGYGVPLQAIARGKAEVFKAVPYRAPISHVLQKMKWQFGASILLILFTTSCFVYMLFTIFAQRKLSVIKNDMINNMTHELKTPLATVSVAIEAMQKYEVLKDCDKANRYLGISKKEINHLSKLIEMILELSLIEHHKMHLFKEHINVEQLIHDVVRKYSFSESSINIQFNHGENIPYVFIDPVHMGNAISNLMDNAIKYSAGEPHISVESVLSKTTWAIGVSDKGIGIPEQFQKNVFDQFFRVPNTCLPRVKGFGLGLTYVKQIVGMHNGTITLNSIEGGGSTFIITIPVKQL